MQATIHFLQRTGRTACRQPVQRGKTGLLSPRTGVLVRPHPAMLRCYSVALGGGPDKAAGVNGTAANGTDKTDSAASAASRTSSRPRAGDLLPEQVQQVLLVSGGMACGVGQPVASIQAQLLMQASHDERGASAASQAPGRRGGSRFAKVEPLYDPDERHSQEKLWLTRFSLQGREEVHARGMALNYTLISNRPWRLFLGGTDPRVTSHERVRCAEVVFPGKCLVQLSLARGMLHGFDGELAGTCAGLARQRYWGWFGHENRRGDEPGEQGWDASLLTTVEPARVAVIGGRAIAWSTLRHWQQTVTVEKTEEALAWEIARMSMPL